MIGLDTSFLVALAISEHPRHNQAQDVLRTEVVEAEETLAVTPQVLAEYMHAVTDPRRFRVPISMGCAKAFHVEPR